MRKPMRWQFSLAAAVYITLWLYYDRSGDAVQSICAAVFHECGHLLALVCLRDTQQKLCFGVYGMRIERAETTRLSYAKELLCAAAGPAANVLLALLLLLWRGGSARARRGVQINLLLAAFNLTPIRPLDGGAILYALLCRRFLPDEAQKISKKAAACTVVPLAAVGILLFIRGRRDYTLFLSSLYVVLLLLPSISI